MSWLFVNALLFRCMMMITPVPTCSPASFLDFSILIARKTSVAMIVLLSINCTLHQEGVTSGGKGGTIPRATNHCWGRRRTVEAPKNPNNVRSTFFTYGTFASKRPQVRRGGAKVASCPGRHQTWVRLCRLRVWWYENDWVQNIFQIISPSAKDFPSFLSKTPFSE